MEVVLTLLAIFYGPALIGWLFGKIFGTTKAVVKSATGKGSLSENLEYELKGMGPFAIRVVEKNLWKEMKMKKDDPMCNVLEIQGRGLPSHSRTTHLGFVTSVLDDTGNDRAPVISMNEGF